MPAASNMVAACIRSWPLPSSAVKPSRSRVTTAWLSARLPAVHSASARSPGCSQTCSLPKVEIERSEEHTSELQSLMRISYAVFCLKKTKKPQHKLYYQQQNYTNTATQ